MKEQVTPEIKKERSKRLIELSNKVGEEYNKAYIEENIYVLIEEKKNNKFYGHTDNYMYVEVDKTQGNIINRIVKVKVYNIENTMLKANFVDFCRKLRYNIIIV